MTREEAIVNLQGWIDGEGGLRAEAMEIAIADMIDRTRPIPPELEAWVSWFDAFRRAAPRLNPEKQSVAIREWIRKEYGI